MGCRDKNTHTLLHIAALGGRLDILQYLINERGCDPMCRDQFGSIPLHCACDGGSLDVVRYLIEDVMVDPSCQDDNDTTPLHAAAFFGHLSVVKALVEDYLCDPGVKDKDALTPGNWAENEGHTHITSYLSSIGKTVFSECVYTVEYFTPPVCCVEEWFVTTFGSDDCWLHVRSNPGVIEGRDL